LDPNTYEWQDLAEKITLMLSKVYSNSLLGDSFDRIEVEEFIKGSVIVNYYVHFKDLDEPVSTNDLKFILNQELEVDGAGPEDDGVSALGRFKVDPIYTDFVVVHDGIGPSAPLEEDGGLPDWAIAVVVIGLGSFAFVLVFGITVMTNRRGRRSTKKKHDLPLTEEMLNELNKNSLSGYGHHGMGHSAPGMTERHHPSTMNGGGYDNYGQDPDDFYDMEDVWNNDRYNFGQSKYKRQSNMSSSSGGGNYSKSTSSPYQSQLYDSWKTEWNAPTFSYDQYNRSGGGGVSSGDDDRHHRHDDRHERGRSHNNGRQSASSYMTKGGRRPSYDDDF